MVTHELLGVDDSASVARCTCGWCSTSASSTARAEARWRIHAAERRAAVCSARAIGLHRAASDRALELVDLQARTLARRQEVADQRRRLREAMARVRADASHRPLPGSAIGLLERALALAGCTIPELWIDYFALGGSTSASGLAAMLEGRRPMARIDHDLVATALNERFADAGFGHPLDMAP